MLHEGICKGGVRGLLISFCHRLKKTVIKYQHLSNLVYLTYIQETKHVILVFSVQGSGHFQGDNLIWQTLSLSDSCVLQQSAILTIIIYYSPATGYAQMTSPIGKDKSPEFGSSSLSGVFSVEWMKKYADLLLILKFKGQNVNNDLG